MKHLPKNQNIFLILIFFIIFVIGSMVFSDYGISIDEDNSRLNGFVSLKYVLELFNFNLVSKVENTINTPDIHSYFEQGNGVVFELPLSLIEILFNLKDSREIFLLRHYCTFLIFFVSLIYLFKIINYRHNSIIIGFIGVLFLILSPRIFSQSFYNSKDIVFMSLNIINLYYGINYLKNSSLKNCIIFSFFSGLLVGTRLLGIYLPFLIIFFKYIQILRSSNIKKKEVLSLIFLIFFILIFIYLFWPYLWEDPIKYFLTAFKRLANIPMGTYTFFLGNYIQVEFVPWYYTIVWILISTPITYLIFFLIGFYFIIKRIFGRLIKIDDKKEYNDLWRGENEKIDILIFLNFFIPIFSTIILHSTLLTGWRHLYFIYPSLIIMSVHGITIFKLFLLKKRLKYFVSLILISLLPTINWMYKNHPHQYVFFNSFYKKNFDKYFVMDYWGLSNYHALKFILNNTQTKTIKVGILGNGDLYLSKSFLDKKDRKKIIVDNEDLLNNDFIIDNYNRWNGIRNPEDFDKIKKKFKDFHDIKVNNIPINSIYINKIR